MNPSAFGTFSLADTYGAGVKLRQAQGEMADKQRLRDLLPKAVGGDKEAMNQVIGIDPAIGMKLTQLDAERKKTAREELGQLAADGRWAMGNPERWAQVQQKWSQRGVDLSGYDANSIERGLMELGQLEKYLEDAPKPESQPSSIREYEYAKGQGFRGGYMDYVKTRYPGAPVILGPYDTIEGGGQPTSDGDGELPMVSSPEEARRLSPGTRFRTPDGRVGTVPGGPTQPASANFP